MVLSSDIVIISILASMLLLFVAVVGVMIIHVFVTGRSFGITLNVIDDANFSSQILGGDSHRGPRMSQADLDKLPCYDYLVVDRYRDCAVCLDAFKPGERCRALPLCKHSFHAECVDGWLLKVPVCPICRDNVAVSSRSSSSSGGHFSGETSSLGGMSGTSTAETGSRRFSVEDGGGFVSVAGGGRLRSDGNGDVVIEMVVEESVGSPDRSRNV